MPGKSNRYRILFMKDWHHTIQETLDTEDGIVGTWQLLAKHHNFTLITRTQEFSEVREMSIHGIHFIFLPDSMPLDKFPGFRDYDAYFSWGSLDRPWNGLLHDIKKPRILQFAGGPTLHEHTRNFDAIGCQSGSYIQAFKNQGHKRVFRSFGTNTNIFKHIPNSPKVFRAIYPASFCLHKNLELFAKTFEYHGLLVGNQNDEKVVSKARSYKTPCLGRVRSRVLSDLYNLSRTTVITCGPHGGAQRCVIESMLCGTPVVVMSDHDKCVEFVEESGFGRVSLPIRDEILEATNDLVAHPPDPKIGIDYILSKWTQQHQYEAYMSALCDIMNAGAR